MIRMRTLFWVLAPISGALTGCVGEPASSPHSYDVAMPLEIDNPLFDYGVVNQGHFTSHTFRLTNRGSEPILFREARTSCTCVGIKDEGALDEPLPPGKSMDVEVGFSAIGASDSETGAVRFTYTTPSEEKFYTTSVRLRASVRPDYEISTDTIAADPLDELNPVTSWHTITLKDNYTDRPIEIKEVSCLDKQVETEVVGPKTVRIRYNAETLTSPGQRRLPIVIDTSSKKKPRTVVMLLVEYQPLIHVDPVMISISSRVQGDVERTMEINTAIGSRLLEVRASEFIVADRIDPPERDASKKFGHHHSVLTVIEETGSAISGQIEILLDLENAGSKTISIPIHRFK